MAFLVTFTFFLCDYGDNVDQRFEYLNHVINQSFWYKYPLEIQKMLLIVQPIAQRPVRMRGFPNLEFNHPFFHKVKFSLFLVDFNKFRLIYFFHVKFFSLRKLHIRTLIF